MKVPFRQLRPYGCGHYTLANLFNDESYLSDIKEGIASYRKSLERSLESRGEPYFLNTLVCAQSYLPVQNRIIDVEIFDYSLDAIVSNDLMNTFRSLFVTINLGALHHLILVCQSFSDGLLYVVDSLREEIQKMTPEQFLLGYRVQEIMLFGTDEVELHNSQCEDSDCWSLYFTKEDFSHLIN